MRSEFSCMSRVQVASRSPTAQHRRVTHSGPSRPYCPDWRDVSDGWVALARGCLGRGTQSEHQSQSDADASPLCRGGTVNIGCRRRIGARPAFERSLRRERRPARVHWTVWAGAGVLAVGATGRSCSMIRGRALRAMMFPMEQGPYASAFDLEGHPRGLVRDDGHDSRLSFTGRSVDDLDRVAPGGQ